MIDGSEWYEAKRVCQNMREEAYNVWLDSDHGLSRTAKNAFEPFFFCFRFLMELRE